MTCKPCTQTDTGRVDFNCRACCARLIRKARPSKALQNAQIAAMARFHGVRWASVWPEVKTLLEAA